MLSNKTKKYFIKSIQAASFLCAVPYVWNDRLERMEVTTSKRRLFFWSTGFLLEILSESFIILRLVQSSITNMEIGGIQKNSSSRTSDSIAELTNLRYKAIVYMLPVAFQIATLIRWEQLPIFVNFYIRFYENIQDEYMIEKWRNSKVRNSCDGVMPYIYYLGNTLATLQSISTLVKPDQPTLFSSLLTDPEEQFILTRLSFFAVQTYLCLAFCFKMQIHLFAVLSYTSPLALIIKELEIFSKESRNRNRNRNKIENMRKKPLLSDEIRSPEKFLLIYRSTELLHRCFNDVFTRIELPCVKGVLMSAIILGAYGCVKLEDARILILSVVLLAGLVSLNATTNCMAELYTLSQQVIHSWTPFLITFPQVASRFSIHGQNGALKQNPNPNPHPKPEPNSEQKQENQDKNGKILVNDMIENENDGSGIINIKLSKRSDKGIKNVLLCQKLKSMRPLTSRIANFYSVKKITVLIVLEFIVETTVNVLIAF